MSITPAHFVPVKTDQRSIPQHTYMAANANSELLS